jgi:hypothetical protein
MLRRHEVEIRLKADHSKAEVARLAGRVPTFSQPPADEAQSFMSMRPRSGRNLLRWWRDVSAKVLTYFFSGGLDLDDTINRRAKKSRSLRISKLVK